MPSHSQNTVASQHKDASHPVAATHKYTLRQLPLPAKLVLTCFLIAVALGYGSAMWQLHLHGDQDGNLLPSPTNVVAKYSGVKEFDGVIPKSKIVNLVSGDRMTGFGPNNMAPAFFANESEWKKASDDERKALYPLREGERLAFIAWANADKDTKKKSYEDGADGKFELPPELVGKPITPEYVDGKFLKITALVNDRCITCHKDGGKAPNLEDYAKLDELTTAPSPEIIAGKWVKSGQLMDAGTLTQSTHAHALSYAVLFSLTGLIFAFTRFWGIIRGFMGPLAVVAASADICCWWLARLTPPYGPIFAYGIMACGGLLGLALSIQIAGSLFDMYRWRGRFLLLFLTLPITVGGTLVMVKFVQPALTAEKEAKLASKEAETNKKDEKK